MRPPPLRKRWGQHHLVDGALCRPLIEFLRPSGRQVLEIGPGGGVLTRELLAAGARVLACEVDLAWAFELRHRLPSDRLRTVVLDAITFPWERLEEGALAAGNLPFGVATRMIESLLRSGGALPRAGFMVQQEVADRLVAGPGDAAYGSFSVLVAARAAARVLGRVRPGSFRPPPKVGAAFVGFTFGGPLPAARFHGFAGVVRQAFARRRKTLRNSLAAAWGKEAAEAARQALGVSSGCRAEELPLEAFLDLHIWADQRGLVPDL